MPALGALAFDRGKLLAIVVHRPFQGLSLLF